MTDEWVWENGSRHRGDRVDPSIGSSTIYDDDDDDDDDDVCTLLANRRCRDTIGVSL